MDLNQKLLAAFQVEHVEHLEGIRACLDRWRQEEDAPDVDEAFRRAHSLKGAARVTGLAPVETLAHHLENLFALLRAKTLPADDQVVHVIQDALDAIEDSAACLLAGQTAPDSCNALKRINDLAESAARRSPPNVAAPRSSGPPMPSVETTPPGAESRPAASSEERPAKGGSLPLTETVRLRTESLDRLVESTSQLLTENLQQDVLARELAAIQQQLAAVQGEWDELQRTANGAGHRPEIAAEPPGGPKYADLVRHELGELSRRVRKTRLLHKQSSWSMRLLAQQLQTDVRDARMVPAESEFQGFRKMLRDLARDEQKQLDFRVAGFETFADRMVLQALKDPLMHVLRNAVTHGIEPPDERARRGKAPAGVVQLTIEAIGNRLTIVVEDDGGGVDLRQVAGAAVEGGFLSEAEARACPADELTRLLFQSGFTTSAVATELSGRGMGLSAVKEAVTRLQGQVELRPRAAAGTVVSITVPLAICTHRLLLVDYRGQTVAIPFFGIEALDQVKIRDVQSVEGVPMVASEGQLTPLATLAALLDENDAGIGVEGDRLPLVIVRSGKGRLAIAVGSLIAERGALVKELGPPADKLGVFLGGILLEDGCVAPVLNPAELINRFRSLKQTPVFAPPATAAQHGRSTILVVDDSFTTRTLETSILETNGYEVRVAVDGVEALQRLRSDKIDLVISDIQMPRLDGFGLLRAIKQDQRLARTPVIMVSSVDGAEEQERGLSLGADAYIVKRRFDHQELLRVVQQVL
ncbi:MAG TPA: response regulator [Pirellulales bacterium]|jgi:two-component system chemotaxis sensor kinase CheA|nr:response regulator [Pirellulales bacterium]